MANINPSRHADMARRGMKRCDWCGYSFHENELEYVEIPGPPPLKRIRGPKEVGEFLFEVKK